MNRVGFVNHLLLTIAVRMPQLTDDVRGVARRGRLEFLLLVVCWKIVW